MTGTATLSKGHAGAPTAVTPSASEVRDAIDSLGEAVQNAVAAGSREQADAAMARINDVLAMVERSPDFSPSYRASIVNAVRGALASMPAQSAGALAAAEAPVEKDADAGDDAATGSMALAVVTTPLADERLARMVRHTDVRVIAVAPMRAPVPVRRGIDVFV